MRPPDKSGGLFLSDTQAVRDVLEPVHRLPEPGELIVILAVQLHHVGAAVAQRVHLPHEPAEIKLAVPHREAVALDGAVAYMKVDDVLAEGADILERIAVRAANLL